MVMGRWTHIAPAAFIAAFLSAGNLQADMPDDPLRFFANCTGRLSAELSHHWLLASPGADDVEALRAAVIDILEAITPDDLRREVLNWRIDARAAHSALLTRATFRGDDWASDRAAWEIAQCAALLLGPATPAHDTPGAADIPPVAASQSVD